MDDTLHAWCSGQEYALAEEVWFRSSVHRGLELLDAVDGALDRAGVVLKGETGDHRVQVTAQPGGRIELLMDEIEISLGIEPPVIAEEDAVESNEDKS